MSADNFFLIDHDGKAFVVMHGCDSCDDPTPSAADPRFPTFVDAVAHADGQASECGTRFTDKALSLARAEGEARVGAMQRECVRELKDRASGLFLTDNAEQADQLLLAAADLERIPHAQPALDALLVAAVKLAREAEPGVSTLVYQHTPVEIVSRVRAGEGRG